MMSMKKYAAWTNGKNVIYYSMYEVCFDAVGWVTRGPSIL